jgi:hypothetical protein
MFYIYWKLYLLNVTNRLHHAQTYALGEGLLS